MNRVYVDDPLVHYKNSTVTPERTRNEINTLLIDYGVKSESISWNWNTPDAITLSFTLEENINGKWINAVVLVDCPRIFNRRPEFINWTISLRALHWYIKTHLETAYARQASLILAFMENVQVDHEHRFRDIAYPMLNSDHQPRILNPPPPPPKEHKRIENLAVNVGSVFLMPYYAVREVIKK